MEVDNSDKASLYMDVRLLWVSEMEVLNSARTVLPGLMRVKVDDLGGGLGRGMREFEEVPWDKLDDCFLDLVSLDVGTSD